MKIKKSYILLVLVLIVAALACGCSGKADAKKSFDATMQAFKSADKSEIDKYYSFQTVTAYIDEADGEQYRDAVLSTLKKMEYKVNSTKQVSDTAVVINAEITTIDYSKVVNSYIDKVSKLVKSEEYIKSVKTMSEEEYKKLLAEKMIESINENLETRKSTTVDATMIKTENGWSLGGDTNDLLNALFANMSNAVNYLS